MKLKSIILVLALLFLLPALVFGEDSHVEVFTPQGSVKSVRQVRVKFSEQMVSFGDPRLEDPFSIDCPAEGQGRWADDRNWIYDFKKDIPAGVVCQFTLRPGLKTLAGEAVGEKRIFSFSTGGPAIKRSYPWEGGWIDEDQIFILTLDAEPVEDSIIGNVWCAVEDINEKIGVEIIKDERRAELLEVYHEKYRQKQYEDMPEVVLKCRQSFPNEKVVKLVWGIGVKSLSGVVTEADQVLHFKSRKPFEAEFSCRRENPEAGCIPFLPMNVGFSAPVSWEYASKIRLRGPNKTYEPNGEKRPEEFVQWVNFTGPFPEESRFVVEMPLDAVDDAGRKLSNIDKFPLEVRTGPYPPLAKFSSRFGIIEEGDPVLPVTLRNLEPEVLAKMTEVTDEPTFWRKLFGRVKGKVQKIEEDKDIIKWLRKLAATGRRNSVFADAGDEKSEVKDFEIPKPEGQKAFEVVGIPLKNNGLYVVELESAILGESLLGEQKPIYVPTAALVTNLSAHFKWGRESSIVWVTSLDTAEPVKGAEVEIKDCEGELLWSGKTDGMGIARINEQLPTIADLRKKQCRIESDRDIYFDYSQLTALRGIDSGLFVMVRTSDDMTFVHSSWDEGIEGWRFRLPGETHQDPIIAHTIFDRSLLRAGETLHMKHIIRNHTMTGFSILDAEDFPKAVAIQHRGSSKSYEFPLSWDMVTGVAETTWHIPEEATLGEYDVKMLKQLSEEKKEKRYYGWRDYWPSGSFRVEEFRIPLMRGIIQPPSKPLIHTKEFEVDLQVAYLSGGGAVDLPVKLRSQTQPRHVSFGDYGGFVFANGEVEEGIKKGYGRQEEKPKASVETQEFVLGKGGALRANIKDVPEAITPQGVVVELEFSDPNGEVQTISQRVAVWPSGIVLGIKPDSWFLSKDNFKFHVVTLDITGKPAPGISVKVDAYKQDRYSHRKRLIGGFYSYEHVTETKLIGTFCEGTTDEKGLLICEVTSPESGNIILQARAEDGMDHPSVTHRSVWVAGKEDWWFDITDNDRIDLITEKKRYEPGDIAKFQVRMPFREATVLVTTEREGVMDVYLKKLSGKEPVIEIPVKENYSPNVFVSVLCVRGRVGDVKPTATVDLGKPAFKLGIAEINVGWQAHELKVDVTAEKEVYKIRETVPVNVKVRTADGRPLPAGSEVAVAAVDEGLLELMPNGSWNLLEDMMRRRGYGVITATAQMQVVGKRHYGLKALPQGGGGGRHRTREMFDTLLFWKARVRLDNNGEASVDIPLNDSLTSFRIVAVAHASTGLFGTGQTIVRTTQDLMLLSGLPQLVRQGDRFTAGFTVRNASDRIMNVIVTSSTNGTGLEPKRMTLEPGKAEEAGWSFTVPHNVDTLAWEVTAQDEASDATDSIRVKQKVIPAVPVRVFQATLMQLEKEGIRMKVERPDDAEKGRGGIRTYFRPRLSDDMSGILDYMKDYDYVCMEQKASVAVALRDKERWKKVMDELPSYLDSDGLVKYFPTSRLGSDVLTSYILSIAHEAGWEIPGNTLNRMKQGLRGFIEGRVIRWSSLPTADVSIRKMAAVEALSRYGSAEPTLLQSITIAPNLWPTSAVIDWFNVLVRVKGILGREKKLDATEQILRSRLNFQGTILGFSTEETDEIWWLMCSVDTNAVKIVLSFLDFDTWKEDMPRLLRGAIGRQKRGRWNTTVANAWGVLALEKFSKKFEAEPVEGISTVVLAEMKRAVDWADSTEGGSISFPWPEAKNQLSIDHEGSGKPWVTVQSRAAIPLKKPFSSGYRFTRTLMPVEQKIEGVWSKGDVVRVRLEIEAQADMTWVVVNDPIPAGATILGSGLGRDSRLLTQEEETTGWGWWGVWPAFKERTSEAFRAYYEYVPKGKWIVEYTIRLNNEGLFKMPETRVEALYSPEMFGEAPNGVFRVGP